MYPYGRANEEGTSDGAIKGWQTRKRGGSTDIEQISPKAQVMQGDLTIDGNRATSTGAGYDAWLAKQKDKPKTKPVQKTDAQREDFFAKAKREREERLKGNTEKPLTPQPPELRPSGKNYRVEAMTDKINNHIAFLEAQRKVLINDEFGKNLVPDMNIRINRAKSVLANIASDEKKSGLPHIPMGKNTHTKNTKGFVHGGKARIKIDPNINEDEETVRQLDLVQSIWNSLPDDVRDGIEILNLKKSRATKSRTIQGGSWHERTKELILNLHPQSRDVEHDMYHEIGHKRWHQLQKENPEKVEKFIQAQKKVGFAPTRYAQSYLNIHQRTLAKIDRFVASNKRLGLPISAKSARNIEQNKKVTADLYQNEIHSELNAYVMGELPERLIIASKARMTGLLNAYKELWDIE